MKKGIVAAVLVSVFFLVPAAYAGGDLAAQMNGVLSKATQSRFWQVSAAEVDGWIKAKKTDFVIVDVRPNPAEYAGGHIKGVIQIPTQNIFSPASLKKLPKNKKLVLVCVTGQTQNLPIVGLRMLGYDAYTLAFGYSAWIKGYHGGQKMQAAIRGANYPVQK